MTVLRASAELITRASYDDGFARRLLAAVEDPAILEALVHHSLAEDDLPWLPAEAWQWFASWRQDRGGPLDPLLLTHLEHARGHSRTARFELRGLVMRDPRTDQSAVAAPADPEMVEFQAGVAWLARHARHFPDGLEVARDCLQFATEAAWYTLRVLTRAEHEQAIAVRSFLTAFAEERSVDPAISSRWAEPGAASPPDSQGFLAGLRGRLREVAAALRDPIAVAAVRVAPIEVLGPEPDREEAVPVTLLLPEEMAAKLAPRVEISGLAGAGALLVWMSGDWLLPDGTRIALYAVDPAGKTHVAEATLPGDRGRLRFRVPWPSDAPIEEILVAVLAA